MGEIQDQEGENQEEQTCSNSKSSHQKGRGNSEQSLMLILLGQLLVERNFCFNKMLKIRFQIFVRLKQDQHYFEVHPSMQNDTEERQRHGLLTFLKILLDFCVLRTWSHFEILGLQCLISGRRGNWQEMEVSKEMADVSSRVPGSRQQYLMGAILVHPTVAVVTDKLPSLGDLWQQKFISHLRK